MDKTQLSEIRNRALGAKNAAAPVVRTVADINADVQSALAVTPASDTPQAISKAAAALGAEKKILAADKRTAIITTSLSHVQFLESGPDDMLALIADNEALAARVGLLESHLAGYEDALAERDQLRSTQVSPALPVKTVERDSAAS